MKKIILRTLLVLAILITLLVLGIIYLVKVKNSYEVITKDVEYTDSLRYAKSGHIIIDVYINDLKKSYPFILDNGASTIIFDNLLEEIDLNIVAYSPTRDASKSISFNPIYKLNKIELESGIIVENIAAENFNSDFFTCNKNVYGIIGRDIMKYFVWQFDFANNSYTVKSDTNIVLNNENVISIPLNKFSKTKDYMELSINNNKKKLVVDLGSTSSIRYELASDSIEYYFKHTNKKIIGDSGYGLNGKAKNRDNYVILFHEVKINNNVFNNVEGSVSNRTADIIGLKFLKNFKTTFNFPRNTLTLEPNDSLIFRTGHFGYSPEMKDNKMFIQVIIKNSQADKLGLKVGDEIIKINNTNIDNNFNFCKYNISELDTLELSIKRNNIIKNYTIIRDYYFINGSSY